MASFLLRRLAQAFLSLVFLSALIFLMSRVTGNPIDIMLPADAPESAREQLSKALGLDQPLYTQYATYVGSLLRGDFGTSIRGGQPVATLLSQRLPASLALGAVAIGITLTLAIPLGVVAAVKRGTVWDTVARLLALIGQSVPSFWIGILLIQFFAVQLRWFPSSGTGSAANFILPAFTMSLFVIAGITRLLRTSMLEVLDSEFVRFARSKGVSERDVIWKHALRNALIEVLGFAGVYVAILVTTAVVVETVFGWPGIGSLAYNAIIERNYTLMQGVVMLTGVIVIASNFAVDILYALVDPRIRLS